MFNTFIKRIIIIFHYNNISNKLLTNRLRIIYFFRLTINEKQNTTIEHILKNNPSCSKCIDKVNNETLCFKMLINDTKDKTQIGCLMSEGLYK